MPAKKKDVKSEPSKSARPDTAMAFIATFFCIIGFLIAFLTKRDDKYVMFYAKQSLILFLFSIALSIIGAIPFIGGFISVLGGILFFIIWIMLWAGALSGEMKSTLIIGELAEKLRF